MQSRARPESKLRIWLTSGSMRLDRPSADLLSVELASLSKRLVTRHDIVKLDATLFADQICNNLESTPGLENFIDDVLKNYSRLRQHFERLSPSVKWLETCLECLLFEDGIRYPRIAYAGGKFAFGDRFLLPLGGVHQNMDVAWDQLLHRHREAQEIFGKLSKGASMIDENTSMLSLDGLSSGILLHEVVGHVSEGQADAKWPLVQAKNLHFWDDPYPDWGVNYSLSDEGVTGRRVVLGPLARMTSESGNGFLGWGSKTPPRFLIRQRNLSSMVRPEATIDDTTPNAIIYSGGLSSSSLKLVLSCIVNINDKIRGITLVIHPNVIMTVSPNNEPGFVNSTICQKAGASHIVGMSSVGANLGFDRPVLSMSSMRIPNDSKV